MTPLDLEALKGVAEGAGRLSAADSLVLKPFMETGRIRLPQDTIDLAKAVRSAGVYDPHDLRAMFPRAALGIAASRLGWDGQGSVEAWATDYIHGHLRRAAAAYFALPNGGGGGDG